MLRLPRRSVLFAVAATSFGTLRAAHAERPWIELPPPNIEPLVRAMGDLPLDLVASRDGRLIFSVSNAAAQAALHIFKNGALSSVPVLNDDGTPVGASITALHIAADDMLWALLNDGHKTELVSLSSTANAFQVTRQISLDHACRQNSRLTSVAVHGTRALIGDAGDPALITVDLSHGAARRVLEANPALVPSHPVVIAGQTLTDTQGIPSARGSRLLLTLSPDGNWLFFQTSSGPLYRMECALLDDPNFSPIEQLEGVVEWRKTPCLSALAIGHDGSLLMADMQDRALLRFTTERIPQHIPLNTLDGTPVAAAPMPDGRIALATASVARSGVWHTPTNLWAISLPDTL